MLSPIAALVRKDLTISWRTPSFLVLSILVPVLFVLIYSMVIQLSATVPVAVAQHSSGPHSDELVATLSGMGTVAGPYLEIRTDDPATAQRMFDDQHVPGLIVIPEGFDERVEAGEIASVELHVHNINSDVIKNLQLRLGHAIYLSGTSQTVSLHEERSVFPETPPIQTYIGTSLLMFGVLYSSIVNTGALLAREWEESTETEVLLTPRGSTPLVTGKWISAALQTAASTGLIFAVLYATIGFPVADVSLQFLGYLLVVFLLGASIGASLGVFLRRSLPIVTAAAVFGIVLFLVSGFETYLRGIAHEGALEWTWWLASHLPVSTIVEGMLFDVAFSQQLPLATVATAVGSTLVFAVGLSGLAVWKLNRGLVE